MGKEKLVRGKIIVGEVGVLEREGRLNEEGRVRAQEDQDAGRATGAGEDTGHGLAQHPTHPESRMSSYRVLKAENYLCLTSLQLKGLDVI